MSSSTSYTLLAKCLTRVLLPAFLTCCIALMPEILSAQVTTDGQIRHETGMAHTRNQPLIYSRNTVRSRVNIQGSDWQARFTPQLRQNLLLQDSTASAEFRLTEAYIEWFTDHVDIRIGRQVLVNPGGITNPASDFLSPLNLTEFLAQNFDDIQLGVTAARLRYFRNDHALGITLVPVFEPTLLPQVNSRWNLLPLDALTGPIEPSQADITTRNRADMQFLFEYSNRTSVSFDLNASYFYGFFPVPSLEKEVLFSEQTGLPEQMRLQYRYEKTHAVRVSGEYRSSRGWISGVEATLWTNRLLDTFPTEITDGATIGISELLDILEKYNDRTFRQASEMSTLGFSLQQNLHSTTVRMQYQVEFIHRYRPEMLQEKSFHTVDVLASRTLGIDFLQGNVNARYQLTGRDFWINPELSYTIKDGLVLNAGSQFFGGATPPALYGHLSFYQFKKNSFSYVKLTAYW